jgi:hypothetical protein
MAGVAFSNAPAQGCELQPAARTEAMLVSALTSMRQANCPLDLMTSYLVEACRYDIVRMAEQLSGLGSISGVRSRGTWMAPNGHVELFDVQFSHGAQAWQIGFAADGRICLLWPMTSSARRAR